MRNQIRWAMVAVLLAIPAGLVSQEATEKKGPEGQKPTVYFKQPVPSDLVLRVFQLKNPVANAAREFIEIHAYRTMSMGSFALAAYATADQMLLIEKLVAGMDVALPGAPAPPEVPSQVRLMLYLLGTGEDSSAQQLPTILQPVVRELEQLFPYRGYALQDSLPVLLTPGTETSVTSSMASPARGAVADPIIEPYQLRFRNVSRPSSASGIRSELQFGYQTNFQQRGGIDTTFSVSPGESVVLGQIRISGSYRHLFVVVHMPKQ